jgi:hypothetical protein
MPPEMTDEQIDEALLMAHAALAAAGQSYRDPDHEADLREAGRGNMTIDQVISRGIDRIRRRG